MKGLSYFMLSAVVLVITVLSVSSCDKDKTQIVEVVPGDCPDTISFATTIEPLVQANCSVSGCHASASSAAGYDLEGHANISNFASNMLTAIKHEGSATPMPYLQPQLNDSLIDKFECWVNQGTLNN